MLRRLYSDGQSPPHGPEEGREVLQIILKASENAEGWQKTALSYQIEPIMSTSSHPDISGRALVIFPLAFVASDLTGIRTCPRCWPGPRDNQFGVIDLGKDVEQTAPLALKAGLRLGSVDLIEWAGMISPDAATRKKALSQNTEQIKRAPLLVR